MNKKDIGRRIGLSPQATKFLEDTVKDMKQDNDFIKINEAKLASEIITRYFEKYFSKEKEQLEKIFFDKKLYLKKIIQNSNSDEELLESVSKYLIGTKKKK